MNIRIYSGNLPVPWVVYVIKNFGPKAIAALQITPGSNYARFKNDFQNSRKIYRLSKENRYRANSGDYQNKALVISFVDFLDQKNTQNQTN